MINDQIIELVRERLEIGAKKYGHENVACDGRDFTEEALEEALDCAVYLAARLVEIQNKKEKQMGRAIDMENNLQRLEARLKLVEDALEEMIQTRVHHVDLVEDVKPLGVEVAPDEEFRAPVTVKRKRKKAEATT